MSKSSFTGRARVRRTRGSVKAADAVSRLLITAGGIGTIVAVTGVAVFLVAVAAPLFGPAEVRAADGAQDGRLAAWSPRDPGGPLAVAVDEYGVLGWALWRSGELDLFRLDDGSVVRTEELLAPGELTAAAFPLLGDLAVLGTGDGSLQLVRIGFAPTFLRDGDVPPEVLDRLARSPGGRAVVHEGGLLQRTPEGQLRLQSLAVTPQRRSGVASGPIRTVQRVDVAGGPLLLALADGAEGPELLAVPCRERESFTTGKRTVSMDRAVRLPLDADRPAPDFIALLASGRDFFLAWRDGTYARLQAGDELADTRAVERGDLVPEGELRQLRVALGEGTLVWADDRGGLEAGFLVRLADLVEEDALVARPEEGSEFGLVRAKRLRSSGGAVTCLDMSRRNRVLVAGLADGRLALHNVTIERELALVDLPSGERPIALALGAKEDVLLAVTDRAARVFRVDLGHPEVDAASLFARVWYEGYEGPTHTWQSSSGHTGFEPKLGLVPLVVGTLKATLYSMLFGAPLAILAAIYSSEFLAARTKAVVKPTIELMASLPSVVLGFLAAQLVAPFVDGVLAGAVAAFVCIPLAFAVGAYLWQLLPHDRTLLLARHRLLFFVPALGLGILAATAVGPAVERWLFAGDLKGWLSWEGRAGGERFASPLGGWLLLLFPACIVLTVVLLQRVLGSWLRTQALLRTRAAMARLDLVRFTGIGGVAAVLSLALAGCATALGLDPRGSLGLWGIDFAPMGIYEQRNSLIVGFVMGFAIIPIIYTIADDALAAVPNHLRSASLGAGATPWQTAVRIVIPTAMSGIFSALMIGLGRAVGETMIVLMATGNTPILDFNAFSGFRTLAANIAYELPEAVRDSTHYRTLFLAALVLFAMTFAVNTVAEVVRLRFRKRAYQL